MRRYREQDSDNARWEGFEFRPGDIVIDAPSKCGTTWTQLLVALLVFDGPAFPETVGRMSLWMEHRVRPVEDAHAAFAAQTHRRFIKSHTPLDGVPLIEGVGYVCVGRDPRDAVLSMIHHGENMDRERRAELIGAGDGWQGEHSARPGPGVAERFDRWLDGEDFPGWNARFVIHHFLTFWAERDRPNVALFHFADYLRDLPGEMQRLAAHLGIDLPEGRAVELASEASLERARARAGEVAPEAHLGLWKDPARFFRGGTVGGGVGRMTPAQRDRYDRLIAERVPADLARWMHRGRT